MEMNAWTTISGMNFNLNWKEGTKREERSDKKLITYCIRDIKQTFPPISLSLSLFLFCCTYPSITNSPYLKRGLSCPSPPSSASMGDSVPSVLQVKWKQMKLD